MKKFSVLFVIFAFALINYSCKDNAVSGSESGNSPFQGNWTLTTNEGNSSSINIGADGKFGTTTNGMLFKGGVTDAGDVNGTFQSSTENGTFKGKLSGSSGNGTWSNSTYGTTGTWSGHKN